MTRYLIYTSLIFLLACSKQESEETHETEKPNFLIIYTDDQNFEHIGAYGGNVYTPNIDRLAKEGALFRSAYVTSPICNPSRFGIMTGQFPSRSKHPGFLRSFPDSLQTEINFNTGLAPDEPNLANIFQKNGYRTGFVGKWDLGNPVNNSDTAYFLPFKRGNAWIDTPEAPDPRDPDFSGVLRENHNRMSRFIKTLGFDYAEAIYKANPEMWRNHKLNVHNMEWVSEAAINFINKSKKDPFFLYMATTLHHIPHPQESLLQGDPRVTLQGYLEVPPDGGMPPRETVMNRVMENGAPPETAFCTWLDDGLGAIISTLEEQGRLDNTVVVFMSDHQTHGKTSLYEDGVNTPMIMRYPRLIKKNSEINAMVQNLDVTPTFLEIAGINAPENYIIDGKSLVSLLNGKEKKVHSELFFEYGWTRAVRTENWKYLALRYSPAAEKLKERKGNIYHNRQLEPHQHNNLLKHPNYWDPDQLYSMKFDKIEAVNFAYDENYLDTLNALKGKMRSWLETFGNHPFGEYNTD